MLTRLLQVPVSLIGVVFMASAAFAQTSSPANGSGQGAPVTINSCGATTSNSGPTVAGFSVGATSSGIKIEFVNESKQAAVLVNFAVDSNGEHFVIRDVGSFAPGVSIVHQYRNGAGQSFILPAFIAPNIVCNVASVKFADGTLWRRGQAALSSAVTSPATALSANPANLSMVAGAEADLFMISGHMSGAFKEIDNCSSVATVSVAATGESAATYSVRPIASGSCTAHVIDEDGHTIAIPITVHHG